MIDTYSTYIVTNTCISQENLIKLKTKHLPILFIDDPGSYYDEVGGYHSCGLGYNPNDVFCGECTEISCKDCNGRLTTQEERERIFNNGEEN